MSVLRRIENAERRVPLTLDERIEAAVARLRAAVPQLAVRTDKQVVLWAVQAAADVAEMSDDELLAAMGANATKPAC